MNTLENEKMNTHLWNLDWALDRKLFSKTVEIDLFTIILMEVEETAMLDVTMEVGLITLTLYPLKRNFSQYWDHMKGCQIYLLLLMQVTNQMDSIFIVLKCIWQENSFNYRILSIQSKTLILIDYQNQKE